MRPRLFAFDIFGTVLDWRRGIVEACAGAGFAVDDATFDAIIDAQSADEQRAFSRYRDVTAKSLIDVLGMKKEDAERIGREAGRFPLYADSAGGLRALQKIAPIVAMTNSDRDHGEDVQRALGVRFDHWLCAEEVLVYKPNPRFWTIASERLGVPLDRSFWHVSAYADYDLEVARGFGVTTCFIERPHRRPGSADVVAKDLPGLAAIALAR